MSEYHYVLGLRPKTWAWFAPLLIVILLVIWAAWTVLGYLI
jgi:hypothetical protein